MKPRVLFIGADHRGYNLKQQLIQNLNKQLEVIDCGTHSEESTDYTDYAQKVAQEVMKNPSSFGVLICGTGAGMAITANRFKGIRAVVCHDAEQVSLARKHNDANILVLSGNRINASDALRLVHEFIATEFEQGKHIRRIEKMDKLC